MTKTTEWQTIESCPKGEWVIVTIEGMRRGYYAIAGQIDGTWQIKTAKGNECMFSTWGTPTHWMQLPDPPEKSDAK